MGKLTVDPLDNTEAATAVSDKHKQLGEDV